MTAIGPRIAQTLSQVAAVHRERLPNGRELTASYVRGRYGSLTAADVKVTTTLATRVAVTRRPAVGAAIDAAFGRAGAPLQVPGYAEVGAEVTAHEAAWAHRWLSDPALATRLQQLFRSYPGGLLFILRPGMVVGRALDPTEKMTPHTWGLLADATITAAACGERLPPPLEQLKPTALESNPNKVLLLVLAVLLVPVLLVLVVAVVVVALYVR